MSGSQNPFDQFLAPQASAPTPDAAAESQNPFDQFLPQGAQPEQTSDAGVVARGLVHGVLPAVGGLPAAGFGAELGAEGGAAAGSMAGPIGTAIGGAVGGVAGGIAGFMGGGAVVAKAQDWALKQLPETWQDALGASDRQQQIDQQQHPVASILGGLAPYALTMSPFAAAKSLPADATAFQRIMANPATARVFGGLGMGGMELGQEKIEGQPVNWTRLAVSTGFGMVFNKPYQFGERLTSMGAELAPRAPVPSAPVEPTELGAEAPPVAPPEFPGFQFNGNVDHSQIQLGSTIVHTNTTTGGPESGVVTAINPYGDENPGYEFKSPDGFEGFTPPEKVTGTLTPQPNPTVAQAADLKVMGAGVTGAVSNGEHQQAPEAEAAAQARASTEQSLIGPSATPPDVADRARQMNPDLFAQYDDLQAQHASMLQWVNEQSSPSDETVQAAQKTVDGIQAQIDALPSYAGADGRRLRAQLRDAQGQVAQLTERQRAWATGTTEVTPEMQQARMHLLSLEHQMWDMQPDIQGAYRTAADTTGAETVEPPPPVVEGEAAPVKPIAEQQAFIAGDVARQLRATGKYTPEYAAAAGQLVASRYTARAAALNGARGTAEDLYRAEGARVVGHGQRVSPVREFAQKPEYDRELAQGKLPDSDTLFNPPAPTAEDMARASRVEDVPLSQARSTQGKMDWNRFNAGDHPGALISGYEDKPVAVKREDGEYLVFDGHHRAAKAAEDGETSMSMHVIDAKDYAPESAGRKSVEHEMSDDELLRQLGVDLDQTTRGKIRLNPTGVAGRDFLGVDNVQPIMRILKNGDFSTFIHESGHQGLAELMRDAEHPEATNSLRSDAKTVRDWLGIKSASDLTRAHQERFASAFERYMREGVAPTRGLAGVFAKFKSWLSTVYDTIDKSGAPISEDIRGVFHRMIAEEPHDTVIAPERSQPPSIADIHEADAQEIEPQNAEAGMDRMTAERTAYIENPPPEVANGIAEKLPIARTDTGSTVELGREGSGGAAGTEDLGLSGDNAGRDTGGGDVRPERGAVSSGVGKARPEGAGMAAKPDGGGPLAPTPTERFPARPDSDLIDLAGNIRVENLTDQAEIAQAIHDSAARNDEFKNVRDTQTKGQMNDLADSMNLTPGQVNENTLSKMFGGTQNLGAKILAARKLVIQSAGVVSAALKKAAESKAPEDKVAVALAIARHDMIQSALAGVTAEWGRAGNAFHNLMEGWDQAKDLNQFLKENTGRDLNQMDNLIRLGASLKDGGQVSKFVRDSTKASFGRMLLEYWINGLISGPATHITYAVGNGILSAYHNLVEVPLAAEIGRARAIGGRQGETIQRGETMARIGGAGRGIAPALKGVFEAVRTGVTTQLPGEAEDSNAMVGLSQGTAKPGEYDAQATMRDVIGSAYSLVRGIRDGVMSSAALIKAGGEEGAPTLGWKYSPAGAIPDLAYKGVTVFPTGGLARAPGRMVASIHSFFRCMNYSIENNGQAYRIATNEGLTGTALDARVAELRQNPTAAMQEQSIKNSNDLTLMGQGGKITQKLTALTNHAFDVPGLGETQLLKFVDPFVSIGSNIIDQSLGQRTPLGIISKQMRDDMMGKNGNIAQDMAQARMLAGTALALTFGTLASQGLISGSGPSDPKAAAVWRMAGNQAHSIRIGNIWYQTNRLGPLGMLAGVAADMYDVAHAASSGDMSVAGGALIHAIAQNILDEGFMSGPAEWMNALEHPETDGASFVQNFAASFVPYSVGMAQMAKAMDPYTRQTRSIMDAIKAKVPGMSETLLPRRDIWGQPIQNASALGGRGLSAIYEQQVSTDPVNIAMSNLAMSPGLPNRKIRNVTLTGPQYDDYTRIAGRMAKLRLNTIVNSPDFRSWPMDYQRYVITETLSQSREAAEGVMMMKYPAIVAAATAARQAKYTGNTPP